MSLGYKQYKTILKSWGSFSDNNRKIYFTELILILFISLGSKNDKNYAQTFQNFKIKGKKSELRQLIKFFNSVEPRSYFKNFGKQKHLIEGFKNQQRFK